jgi:hypothetical protein
MVTSRGLVGSQILRERAIASLFLQIRLGKERKIIAVLLLLRQFLRGLLWRAVDVQF